jgi:hypothetical protein
MAAQSLQGSQSALGEFYRPMRTRLGVAKAIAAAAHKLARIIYHVLTTRITCLPPAKVMTTTYLAFRSELPKTDRKPPKATSQGARIHSYTQHRLCPVKKSSLRAEPTSASPAEDHSDEEDLFEQRNY